MFVALSMTLKHMSVLTMWDDVLCGHILGHDFVLGTFAS